MAVKTFSTGEVLTAADTNTYLNNGGLVYVANGTLANTSTNFQSCFSATYNNYRIMINNISLSGAGYIYFRFLSGSTAANAANYYWAINGYTSAGTASDDSGAAQTLTFTGFQGGAGVAGLQTGYIILDVCAPFVAQRTFTTCQAASYTDRFLGRAGMCEQDAQTSYDGIQFLTNSAVTMGGTVTIYGYRLG